MGDYKLRWTQDDMDEVTEENDRLKTALMRLYFHAVAVREGLEGDPVAVLATQTLLYDLGVFEKDDDDLEDEE